MSDNIQEPNQQAEIHFHNCYQDLFCKINFPRAWQEICQACQLAQNPIYIALKGYMWFEGKGVRQDKISANRICQEVFPQLLLRQDALSYTLIGLCYLSGLGTAQDTKRSISWLNKAAEQNQPVALATLGSCYNLGCGVKQNNLTAYRYFLQASQLEDPFAMYALADCYLKGDGVIRDFNLAVDWLHKAVELGEPMAMISLAKCYSETIAISCDASEAENLIQQAENLIQQAAASGWTGILPSRWHNSASINKTSGWWGFAATFFFSS
jgi:TPR repeat protein